jgi:hypothetical protein
MKPVDQTVFGAPLGNCLSACVASLLHLRIDEVPTFCDKPDWLCVLNAWLRERGLWAMCYVYETSLVPPGFWIMGGKSPRGDFLHAVVMRGSEMVHDPHPSRDGVLSRVDCTILVPIDPARG